MSKHTAYLQTDDYRSVWCLAHDLVGLDPVSSNSDELSQEARQSIYRILVAIRNKLISVRTSTGFAIFGGEDFLDMVIEFPHFLKIYSCVKKGKINKQYLDSLYVWRPEVIRWCSSDFLPVPSYWQIPAPSSQLSVEKGEELPSSENMHWYDSLTDRQKRIAGGLFIASRIWEENNELGYEDVYLHPDMIKYDKPRSFPSLGSFKNWTKDIAPEAAKNPGRRGNTKL